VLFDNGTLLFMVCLVSALCIVCFRFGPPSFRN